MNLLLGVMVHEGTKQQDVIAAVHSEESNGKGVEVAAEGGGLVHPVHVDEEEPREGPGHRGGQAAHALRQHGGDRAGHVALPHPREREQRGGEDEHGDDREKVEIGRAGGVRVEVAPAELPREIGKERLEGAGPGRRASRLVLGRLLDLHAIVFAVTHLGSFPSFTASRMPERKAWQKSHHDGHGRNAGWPTKRRFHP